MQSKTSLFNKTLFLNNLRRHWPLWALPAFFAFLLPLAGWFTMVRMQELTITVSEAENGLYHLAGLNPVPMMLYAPLCALVVWKFMYESRSVGMMHTMPITRGGIFVTNTLSGLAMCLIPYVPAGVLYVLITLSYGGFSVRSVLLTTLVIICHAVLFFGMATVFAMIAGTFPSMIIFYFIGNFLEIILDSLFTSYASNFLFGITTGYSGALEFLSPVVYLLNNVQCVGEYAGTPGYRYVYHLENIHVVYIYAAAGIAMMVIAWLMYRARRSESAGDVVAVRWLRPVFKYGFAACVGLTGARVLYAIFFDAFPRYYRFVPMCICLIVMSLIGYYAACMLLQKTLKVFSRSSLKGAGIIAAAAIVLCAALHADLFHVVTKVPEPSEVAAAYVTFDGNEYTLARGTDDRLIAEVTDMHRAIIGDRNYYINAVDRSDRITRNVLIVYQLDNGKKIERSYSLLYSPGGAAPASVGKIDELLSEYDLLVRKLHLTDPAGTPAYHIDSCNIYGHLNGMNVSYDWAEITDRKILAGLQAALAEDLKTCDIFGDTNAEMYIELYFETDRDPVTESYKSDYCHVVVRPEMKHTIAFLETAEYSSSGTE